MRIMTQSRARIIKQPRQVWVTPIVLEDDGDDSKNTKGYVMCKNLVLGEYESVSRAKEVLKELFEAQSRGEVNYYMPQE